MSNLQFYIAVVLPMVAVLASLTISLIQISGIRTDFRIHQQQTREDFRDLRREFSDALQGLRDDMKIDRAEMKSELAGIREDIRSLTGKVAEIDTRLSVIEERIK